MKRYSLALFFMVFSLAFATQSHSQTTSLTAQTAKAYAKASTTSDTSATLTVGAYPWVTLHTTSTGSDSSVIRTQIDALINGVWVNSMIRDTLTLGRPEGSVLAGSTKGQVRFKVLRSPSSDLLNSASQLRLRAIHASGAGDSNAALTYTQKVILRK